MPITRHALDYLAAGLARTVPASVPTREYVDTEAPLLDEETRAELARGVDALRRLSDTNALDAIHALLDGEQWHAGTIETVAEIVARTGRTIAEPEA